MVDWLKLKNEYINGNISYRKLAEKHDVSFSSLKNRAVTEKWVEQREKQRNKIDTKLTQKTAEKIAEKETNRLLRISNAADKLLDKIEEATEQLDRFIVTSKSKTKTITYVNNRAGFGKPKKEVIKEDESKEVVEAGFIDRKGLKELASALKDLKDIQSANEETDFVPPKISFNIIPATPDIVEKM